MEQLRIPTPPSATLAPPGPAGLGSGKDSVALRAMRSVRSLARIGSWAQLRPNPDATAAAVEPAKDKESDGKKKKKKDKDKDKGKEKDKDKDKDKGKETIRYSGSSFEAGTLSASPTAYKHESKSLGKKKASILGLGLPSTMRLPSSRSGSTSSITAANTANHRLSLDSATLLGGGILARGRTGSTMSTTSSLRPMSTKSCVSRESSGSSGTASVRWDEAGLQTVKEIRQKDKEARRKEKEKAKEKAKEEKQEKKSKKSKSSKDSTRKSSDSRKRTPLSAIFPGTVSEREEDEAEQSSVINIARIEEVTVDRHQRGLHEVEEPMATPVKHVRHLSEQPLGRGRPKPYYEGDDGEISRFPPPNRH